MRRRTSRRDYRQEARTQRDHALDLARRHFSVFPLPPNEKMATLKGWPDLSSSVPRHIRETWPMDAPANIAVHAGPSCLLIIDIDVVCEYSEMLDLLPAGIPDTFTVRTASGKWHLYFGVPFKHDFTNRNLRRTHYKDIDVKVGNGYVVGPGSVINGVRYEVEYDDPIAELTPGLAKWAMWRPERKRSTFRRTGSMSAEGIQHSISGLCRVIVDAEDGEQNNTIHWAACRAGEMIARGEWDEDDAEATLEEAARNGNHPSERATPTIRSGITEGLAS